MAMASRWRLYINDNNVADWLTIADLAFASSAGGSNLLTTSNISADYSIEYPINNVLDGNSSTFWGTPDTYPRWIEGTFVLPVYLYEIRITARASYNSQAPKDFQIKYYNTATSTWDTLTTYTGQTFTSGETKTFVLGNPMGSFSGNITESSAIVDWSITAIRCGDGAFAGKSLSSGTTYSVSVTVDDPCNIIIAPKIDGKWRPSWYFPVGYYMCSTTPDSEQHIWKCTVNSGDINYYTKKLLLHFDGADGSTTFIDSSSNPKTFTVNGNAQLSTANKVFGTASYLGDGNGDYLSCTHNDFLFTTGNNHTIEFRFRCANNGTEYFILAQGSSTNYYQIGIGAGAIRVNRAIAGGSGNDFSVAHTWDANWHHFAWCKVGSTNTIYIDGVSIGSWTRSDWSFVTNALNVGINAAASVASSSWNGNIDELVIDTSVAYYTANFTPNTAAFGSSGITNTVKPTLALSGDTVDNNITWTYVAPLVNPITLGPRIPS